MLFAHIGQEGQQQLMQKKAAIVGLGALGTVIANHLVRAGIGHIKLIDRDFVEMSNLQRQMLYTEQDALQSRPKATAAKERLQLVNSTVKIEAHIADVNPMNAEQLLTDVDVILDGSDNFKVRYLVNDIAIKHHIPWVYGGAVSARGTTMSILPNQTPCLRCVFPTIPAQGSGETCDTIGVIAPIIDMIASYQVTEALKILLGQQEQLHGKMIQLDLWSNQYSAIKMDHAKKDSCPTCGLDQFDFLEDVEEQQQMQSMCGRDSVQITPHPSLPSMDLDAWKQKWERIGKVEQNPYLLKLLLHDGMKIVLFRDGRAIIQGTEDISKAKSLYSQYIGL
ncbi:ThiF family adenylyltransferase [Longirhabdus pacifica]|uniref:ThiF family adenylyltransferase n=1 Tax=Longirhabdus pacifica TaxID=2305227 RepID=UPI001F0C7B42|nr:ThiF family adenylyltransferase [Longirhabdus pacifica]